MAHPVFANNKLCTGTDAKRRTTVGGKCVEASTPPANAADDGENDNDDDDDEVEFTPVLLLRQIGLVVLAVAVFVGFIVVLCKAIIQCTVKGP